MQRGDIWWADTGEGGDRPVLVMTRDPVADRINSIVVAVCTTRARGLVSEMAIGPDDGMPAAGVVRFDVMLTIHRTGFRRHQTSLTSTRMTEACGVMAAAMGCG